MFIFSIYLSLYFRPKMANKGIYFRSKRFCPFKNLDKGTKKYGTKMR